MPRLNGAGGLPTFLRLMKIPLANVKDVEKRANFPLDSKTREKVLILCSLHCTSIASQLLGGTLRRRELKKFAALAKETLESLPRPQYRPSFNLAINSNSEIVQKNKKPVPAEFALRNMIEGVVSLISEVEAKFKNSPNKSELWAMWAMAVSQTLSQCGYNTNASQHTDKRRHDNESPFVYFMIELDAEILKLFNNLDLPAPAKALLPTKKTKSSMAKAINRARSNRPRSLAFSEVISWWRKDNPFFAEAKFYEKQPGTVIEEI